MKLEIRFANKNDLKTIARLVNDVCIYDTMWLDYTYDELMKEFEVMFDEKIEKHDWIQPICLIAEYDNEIVGMINYRQSYEKEIIY